MVNRLARSAGKVSRFAARGQITSDLPVPIAQSGEEYKALASVFEGLASEVGTIADRAVVRERSLEGLVLVQESNKTGARGPRATTGSVARQSPASNAEGRAMRFFLDNGFSRAQSAGIVGNLISESALRPDAVNPKSKAFGLAQWLGSRKTDFFAFAKKNAADAGDFDTQLSFILSELQGPEKRTFKNLQAAATAEQAAAAFAGFERAEGFTRSNPKGIALWKERLGHSNRLAGGGVDLSVSLNKPLALRRDGTLGGDAFDKAVRGAQGWRDRLAIVELVGDAYDANKDDPAGFNDRLEAIRGNLLEGVTDPVEIEARTRAFEGQSLNYRFDVQANAAKAAEKALKFSARKALDAEAVDLERQAFISGSSPGGEAVSQRLLAQGLNRINRAEEDGALTPAQAATRRKAHINTVVTSQIAGTFDALETPEEKQAFADGLLPAWKANKGALARLPREDVEKLANKFSKQAEKESDEQDQSASDAAKNDTTALGFELLDEGELGLSWVETNKEFLSNEDYRYFKRNVGEDGNGNDVPREQLRLMIIAGSDPQGAIKEARAAYVAGTITKSAVSVIEETARRFEEINSDPARGHIVLSRDTLNIMLLPETGMPDKVFEMHAKALREFDAFVEVNPEESRFEMRKMAVSLGKDVKQQQQKWLIRNTPLPKSYRGSRKGFDQRDFNQAIAALKRLKKIGKTPVQDIREQTLILKTWSEILKDEQAPEPK